MTTATTTKKAYWDKTGRTLEYKVGYDDGFNGKPRRIPRGINRDYDHGYSLGSDDYATQGM